MAKAKRLTGGNTQGFLRPKLEFAQPLFCQSVIGQSAYCDPAVTQNFATSFAITRKSQQFQGSSHILLSEAH